jgi:hypothetical protein
MGSYGYCPFRLDKFNTKYNQFITVIAVDSYWFSIRGDLYVESKYRVRQHYRLCCECLSKYNDYIYGNV